MAGQILKTFQFYGYAVIQILIEPKRFFSELPDNASMIRSFGFCVLCGVFYAGAGLLTFNYDFPVRTGIQFFLTSLSMAVISSFVSYAFMVLIMGNKTGFEMIFCIHAFSSGIMLLISWVSFLFWVAEFWKWWLIYTGFRNSGRMSGAPAALVTVMTMATHFFVFFYLYPAFFRV